MNKINLDLKDRKILYELDSNSRQPLSQIAKKVGLSKEVVNYRIRRLEDQKIITHTKIITGFETGKTYYWKVKAKTDILNNFYSESVTEHFICN